MKKLYLTTGFLLLGFLFIPASLVQGQSIIDSLFVQLWTSEPDSRAGFDVEEMGLSRFDATGDGVADFITVEDNDNGVPVTMRVTNLKEDEVVMVIDLRAIRAELEAQGLTNGEIGTLRFLSFFRGSPVGLAWAVFEANDSPVVFIYDAASPKLFCYLEKEFASIADMNSDGYPEMIVRDNALRQVQVWASGFAPGN